MNRMYRSENDLGKRSKEIATQTLRETATQTGDGVAVVVEAKRLVKRKKRSKSVSSAGTQTGKKEKGVTAKSKSIEQLAVAKDSDSDKEKVKKEKRRTKRSKSMNSLENAADDTDASSKPKPKPKPKPRKSTSADNMLEEKTSTTQENQAPEANSNPYYPGSEGFMPQQPYYPSQGYQGVQQTGVPSQPGNYPAQMSNYPGQPGNYPPQSSYYAGQGNYPVAGPSGQFLAPGLQGHPPPAMVHNAPVQGVPKKRNKSNWDTLCELTDGQVSQDRDMETNSVASSVFTNNPASLPKYGNPSGNPYYGNQQFYNYPPPPPVHPHHGMLHSNSSPDYENAGARALDYENAYTGPHSGNLKTSSSWDALKAATNQNRGPSDPRNRTESVV